MNSEIGDPAWPCEPLKAENLSWLQLEGEMRKQERFEMREEPDPPLPALRVREGRL